MKEEKFTFFYGSESPFSNFHPVSFTLDGIAYNCTEQYMMHQKAITFNDDVMAKKILESNEPKQQKAYGRMVSPFDPEKWSSLCKEVVYKGCKGKFTQNEVLLKQLLNIEGTTLVEASPRDTLWGIGYSEKNPKAKTRHTWRGKNWLGEILTQLRNDLLNP